MKTYIHLKNELETLEDIFDNGKRIFRIPDYQRGYSWEEQQRKDLLSDIQYLIKSGYEYRHYTGTIVASLNDTETNSEANGYQVFDVVDGQQRMTSLILLLSVICRSLKEPTVKSEEIFSKFIMDGPTGNTVRKLHLGKEQDGLFERLLTEGITAATEVATSKSDQNLKNAVYEFHKWLKEDNINIDDVLECICGKLGFLLYAPENDKELGIMFEVINNRGKALTELEKIKNYLIYYADKNDKRDIKNQVNKSWSRILNNLNKIDYTSNESEDSFLRNCWIVFTETHKSKSYYVYDGLKEKWPPDNVECTPEILRFIRFLEDAATFYVKYLKRENVGVREKCWLERISYHPADASITPLILAIFSKVENQDDRNELFELLEKLNFRFYGTGIAGRSDSGQGDLFGYANKFFNHYKKDKDGDIIDVQWLKNELTNFVDKKANDMSLVKNLTLDKDEAGDYFNWSGLKFFLASYEEHLREEHKKSTDLQRITAPSNPEAPNDLFHREHIWAKEHLTEFDNSRNLNVNKRRLGNFLLLEAATNLSAGNKPIEDKVKTYFDNLTKVPDTLMSRELNALFVDAEDIVKRKRRNKTSRYWNDVYQRFLDKREEKMINFALERWRVPALGSYIKKVRLNSLNGDNKIYTTET